MNTATMDLRSHKNTQVTAADVPGVKTWHILTFATAQAAVDFVNLPPAQVAGEVVIAGRTDGQVDLLYFL